LIHGLVPFSDELLMPEPGCDYQAAMFFKNGSENGFLPIYCYTEFQGLRVTF